MSLGETSTQTIRFQLNEMEWVGMGGLDLI